MNKKSTVSAKTAGKIGLTGSISIIIASVVGVGIFFKNGGVFKNNGWNSTGVVLSWILAGIIALFTAFSYAEIVTVKGLKNANAGLAGWGDKLVGYNFGRHLNLAQSSFYYSSKTVAMGSYAAVAIFQIYYAALGENKFHAGLLFGGDTTYDKYTTLIVMLVGMVLVMGFMCANLFSKKFGNYVAKGATIIKFFPILMIILIGLVFGILLGAGMWNNTYIKQALYEYGEVTIRWSDSRTFTIGGVFKSIPAILFAFDSFLVIGNVQGQVENPEKNVPKAIVFAMIIAGAAQILITVAEITMGTGNPYLLLRASLTSNIAYIICVCFISVSIVIAALGVINGCCMAGMSATQALIDDKVIAGYRWADKLSQKRPGLGGFTIYTLYCVFIWLVMFIPSIILNTSQIYDGFSTLAVLFFFGIYGIVILGGLINRKTGKHEIHKVGYFVPFGIVAVIGCFFTFGYCVFYQFGVQCAMNPMGTDANSFGFAMVQEGYRSGLGFYNWQAALVFWSAAIFFIVYPFLNDIAIVMTDRHYPYPLLWESSKKYQKYSIGVMATKDGAQTAVPIQTPVVEVDMDKINNEGQI